MPEFRIYGVPAPKGSMNAYAKKTSQGWRGVVTHSKRSKDWERVISEQLDWSSKPLDTSLKIDLHFFLHRPKTVKRDHPSVKPDLDKLVRAVFDALQGVIYDDCRVVELTACKSYDDDEEEGVRIRISEVE